MDFNFLSSCSSVNTTRPHWWYVNIGSGNDWCWVTTSPYLSQCLPISVAIWYHYVLISIQNNKQIIIMMWFYWAYCKSYNVKHVDIMRSWNAIYCSVKHNWSNISMNTMTIKALTTSWQKVIALWHEIFSSCKPVHNCPCHDDIIAWECFLHYWFLWEFIDHPLLCCSQCY